MPFISYTKARHFEWQAERGGEYARVFSPPPLTSAKKRLIKRVNKIEAMYETARVSVKVKRYACC